MWKKIDKFFLTIGERMNTNLAFLLTLIIGSFVISAVLSFLLSKLIASFFEIFMISASIFAMFRIAITLRFAIEMTKTEKQLESRQLSEYVAKYQKYVNLVTDSLKAEEYRTVSLPSEWLKTFDKHLTHTAMCCGRERNFTDFEVAACLMYALDGYNTDVNFAFHCAKLIISKPSIYSQKYILGNELILEINGTMEEVQFSNLDENSQDIIVLLLETYLLQKDSYYEVLKLADFLRILYLSCEQ